MKPRGNFCRQDIPGSERYENDDSEEADFPSAERESYGRHSRREHAEI
jgi:hypothetical protein